MRELTDHKPNELNNQLRVVAWDDPGAGGAHHKYFIDYEIDEDDYSSLVEIDFQNGPIAEVGVNGVTHEAILAILIDRLRCFQAGPYKCWENEVALVHLEDALDMLHHRTRQRLARGVEGTSNV